MKMIFVLLAMIMVLTFGIAPASSQVPTQIPRIGMLLPWSDTPEDDRKRDVDAFLLGLKELGYIDERSVSIEWRYADGKADRLHHFAQELVRLNPSVIVASGTTAISIVMKATKTIPVVMLSSGNPVTRGFVKSLSMPGGNVTGFSSSPVGHGAKRLELLKETFPTTTRVVIFNADRVRRRAQTYEKDGKALGLNVELVHVAGPKDLNAAFAKIANMRSDALMVVRNVFTIRHAEQIAEFALRNRLPAIYEAREFVTSGGLMS